MPARESVPGQILPGMRGTGQREEAREHLTTATTMYRAMGMTYWLEQAEAESQPLT